jgi:hypothetical protein
MHSAAQQWQTLVDFAPVAEPGAKAAKSCLLSLGTADSTV